ncbi:hypothetical protein BDF19DRAFT_421512 [Syncephalis fuscata]|nr:hypothetical protein BDF19DRAFT_421512 [Syncephalis fuscata]
MFSARPRSIAGPLMDMRTEALLEDLASDPYGQIPSPCFSPPPPPPPESIQASNHSQHHHSGSGIRTLSLHRKSSLDVTSQVDHSLGGSDTPLAKRLIGVVFRDRYAANMALKLLFRVTAGGHELELYYFDLLMQLLHINPQNQQLMCAHEGLEWMVRSTICGILSGSTTLPPTSLANLIALIGSHDIGPGEAALLLNAIYDPLRVAENAPYGPRLEDNLQVTSQTVAELQRELLLALLEIASRLDPVYMFSFDGAGALLSFPLDKLPGQKFGYTLSCWLKVTVFLGDDTGFLCYEDPQGCFFELYLRRLAQSNRCCLCVRTQQHPMPPEDFVFYGYDFANASDWHHIALAHSRQEMTLFVNGQLTQTCNTFHYPRVSSKERICMGVVGRRGHGLTTGEYFCGQLSGITFFEGIWDGSVARRVFDHGLRYGDNLRAQLNIEHREALVIDPKTCFVELASSYASNNNHPFINTHHYGHNGASVSTAPITSNTTVNPAMMVTNIANIATPMMNSNTAITTTNITHTETPPPCYTRLAGCSVHYMRKLGDVISQVGGPQVCFPMMETSLEYQLIGLNIVVCLLLKSPMNREQFTVSSGFHVIRHLLATSRWPLTMDHFELLLDISCDGHTEHAHRLLVHWEGMDMYTDLLLRAPENVQLEAIHLLVNVLLDLRKNLAWWRAGPGFVLLFDLLLTLPVSQHQFLFRLLDAMMEDLSSTELRHLLDFIAYEKRQYLDHKFELLSSVNGLTLLISFLDLPSERFRLLVLKLLGVLMSSNVRQSRTLMTRVNGFDAMWLFLAPFPVTSDLVQTLLGVALNFYRCDQSTNIASNNNNNTANTSLPTLVYPELIRLLLELLRACDNINLMFDLLADVKRMLTPDNMVTLWEHPWPEWFAVFLQDRGVMEKSNYGRIASMVHAIAQRMMVFDMARRISIINRLKGAVAESETFQLQLIDDVLAYYERRPCLDTERIGSVKELGSTLSTS